ncbi:MAG: LysM peptidoglycan-binding domain-containing protein [Chthoniobacterales bacterium]|nr:LysM peptidoglycan-binding domain-containing protein [Chthoniobacterales bacterium]
MKWLFALLLAVIIFGSAAFFGYHIIVKPEMALRAEQNGTAPEEPRVDISLPEFQAAAQLRQEGKLNEARAALTTFLTKYANSLHTQEAKDLLGEVNMQILMSKYPSPEKQEYTVKSGDVLARVAAKTKSTPELIMRTNNLRGTMLHIGDKLLISHPEFSLFIQRNAADVILLDNGAFFKRYRARRVKLPPKQPARITTRVAETIAFRDGKRVGFGTPEYIGSTRWIRLAQPGYVLYAEPSSANAQPGGVPPPPTGFAMLPADVEELSGLVNSKTAVTITD